MSPEVEPPPFVHHEVRVEARVTASLTCFVAQREWARVVVRERGARCTLRHNKGLAMLSRFPRAAWAATALAISTASLADYHVDILPPVTPVSTDIYHLHWGILWLCVVIFIIVFGT